MRNKGRLKKKPPVCQCQLPPHYFLWMDYVISWLVNWIMNALSLFSRASMKTFLTCVQKPSGGCNTAALHKSV